MRYEYKPMSELRGNRTEDIVHDYVVIDIETTGLKYSDDIIEFAAIRVKDDEPIEELSFLVKPQKAIPDRISQLTGITNSMVENESFFVDRISDILEFMGDDLILGHNVTFDIDRLNYNIYTNTGRNLSNDYIDTLHLAHDRITDIVNYQLETLADYFSIDVNISHRAVDDCCTTIECYKHLSSIRPHIDDFTCNQKKSNYYGYHFLNKCDEIIYKKPGKDRNLSDIVYTLYGRPYYASPVMFDYILRQNGAKESSIYYFEDIVNDICYFDYDIKKISSRLKRLTHIIVGKNKYEECVSNKDVVAIAQEYNIEIVSETEIYKLLGIELPEFKTQSSIHSHIRSKDVSATNTVFDEHHSLFNKTIVITGALNTLSRSEAYLKIKNVGGLCGDSITKKTNYLVTNSEKLTGKMKKALEYKQQGQDIKIINEAELIKLLNNRE